MDFIKLKKVNRREMSDFTANHLLFEFARDTLDPERKKAIEVALENSPELQNEFIKLINGIQYCEKLSETLVNDNTINQIEHQSSQVNFIVNRLRWHQWPLGFKWLLEATVVGLFLVLFLNLLPLNRIIHLSDGPENQAIIAEVDRKKKSDLSDMPQANKQDPVFVDEEVKVAPVKIAAKESSIKPVEAVPITLQPGKDSATMATQPTLPEKSVQAKSPGMIYRGQFLITNAEMVSPKIKDKIIELGGQKAGEVEIGWQKTPHVYYFHFTVPEAKLPELEAVLKDYSTNKMIKESHPRVMPDGIIRLLFTVEEKAAPNK